MLATSAGQPQATITGNSAPVHCPQPKRARDTIYPEWGVKAPKEVIHAR